MLLVLLWIWSTCTQHCCNRLQKYKANRISNGEWKSEREKKKFPSFCCCACLFFSNLLTYRIGQHSGLALWAQNSLTNGGFRKWKLQRTGRKRYTSFPMLVAASSSIELYMHHTDKYVLFSYEAGRRAYNAERKVLTDTSVELKIRSNDHGCGLCTWKRHRSEQTNKKTETYRKKTTKTK